MHSRRRPRFESLEDRLTPSFAYWGTFTPLEYNQLTGPDAVVAGVDPTTNQLWLDSADFNADSWNDLVRVTFSQPGNNHLGEIFLSRTDGTLDYPLQFDPGPDPRWIATGDFAVGGFDGRADFAIYHYYGFDENGVFGTIIDAWYVYRNMGNWPVVGPELAGDFNRNGTVDAADYTMWRNTLGTSMTNYSGADGNGNGVVDQNDHAVWRAHFGELAGSGSTLPSAEPLSATVPEPATEVLFSAGLVAMCGTFFYRSQLRRTSHRANRRHAIRRPRFEPLEDRLTLSYMWDGIFYSEPSPGVVWAPSFPVFPSYQGTLALLADFTSDGIPDQISANAYDGVGVRPGRGDGTFADQIPFSFYAPNESLAGVADLNSDGKLDVFIASRRSDNVHTTFANVLTGAGDGSFVTYHFPIDYVTGGFTIPVAIGTGDLFGTGRTDVVIAGTNDYDALYVVLANTSAVGPTLPGDFNRDGTVDAADYVAWRHSPNDFGGDPGGYDLWRANFGQTVGGDAEMSADAKFAVPEPGGLALLTVAAPALVRRRKDRRT